MSSYDCGLSFMGRVGQIGESTGTSGLFGGGNGDDKLFSEKFDGNRSSTTPPGCGGSLDIREGGV